MLFRSSGLTFQSLKYRRRLSFSGRIRKVRRTTRRGGQRKWVCVELYKRKCGTLQVHLVAFWIWLPIRRIRRRGSRIVIRRGLPDQCAPADASHRQRTYANESPSTVVCCIGKDGDPEPHLILFCGKQNRVFWATELASSHSF